MLLTKARSEATTNSNCGHRLEHNFASSQSASSNAYYERQPSGKDDLQAANGQQRPTSRLNLALAASSELTSVAQTHAFNHEHQQQATNDVDQANAIQLTSLLRPTAAASVSHVISLHNSSNSNNNFDDYQGQHQTSGSGNSHKLGATHIQMSRVQSSDTQQNLIAESTHLDETSAIPQAATTTNVLQSVHNNNDQLQQQTPSNQTVAVQINASPSSKQHSNNNLKLMCDSRAAHIGNLASCISPNIATPTTTTATLYNDCNIDQRYAFYASGPACYNNHTAHFDQSAPLLHNHHQQHQTVQYIATTEYNNSNFTPGSSMEHEGAGNNQYYAHQNGMIMSSLAPTTTPTAANSNSNYNEPNHHLQANSRANWW